jgi:hypothetical protein
VRSQRAHGAFEEHLREAIALNMERAPRYAALSGGASRPISYALIAAEWLLVPVARWFDRRAEPWRRAGIPLLETLFVPMASAPEFVPSRPARSRPPGQSAPRAAGIRRRVRTAWRTRSFAGAGDALRRELATLTAAPGVDCMVRHLLESACRLAQLAPGHVALARERGLPSPGRLLGQILWLHLWGLDASAMLDQRALPLQARGIPILAQDLPPIPIERTELR